MLARQVAARADMHRQHLVADRTFDQRAERRG